MRYRHLFFDLDHTLWDFDSNARLTLQQLFQEFGLEGRPVDFDRFHLSYLAHNARLWKRFRMGYIRMEELRWKRMWHTLLEFGIPEEQLARRMGDRFVELLPLRTVLFPETLPTLGYLRKKGYALHLITNGFEKTQRSKIRNSGIAEYFSVVVTSESSQSMKPRKEIFDYALDQAGAVREDCVMIGDCPDADIRGAREAGLDQIHVNHLRVACEPRATYTVYSVGELREIL